MVITNIGVISSTCGQQLNHFSDPDITQVMYKTNNLAAGYAECTWNKSDFNPIWPTALAGGSSTL